MTSLRFMKSLGQNGADTEFLLYACTDHVDFVFDWIEKGAVNEGTLDVDATDKA